MILSLLISSAFFPYAGVDMVAYPLESFRTLLPGKEGMSEMVQDRIRNHIRSVFQVVYLSSHRYFQPVTHSALILYNSMINQHNTMDQNLSIALRVTMDRFGMVLLTVVDDGRGIC